MISYKLQTKDNRLKPCSYITSWGVFSRSFSYIIFFCLLSLFSSLTGCTSLGQYNPATGRQELIFISTTGEVEMGQAVHQDILSQYSLSTNQSEIDRVYAVGQKVAQISDRQDYQYNFFVVEQDELNAFTTPGGNIYVFSGLLDRLKTDDQLASVLAHEIGHCAARHTIKKFQAALGYNLIGSIVFTQLGMEEAAQELAVRGTGFVMGLVFSSYNRQDEYEADRLGIKYMYLAGYDPSGMIETFQILKEESKGESTPLILRSHPYLDSRIIAAQREIELVKNKFEENDSQ